MPSGSTASGVAKTVAAVLFAVSPLVAGAVALHGLRPPPARAVPSRQLTVAAGDDTRAVAQAHAGVAAVPAGALGGALRLDHLPFDEVILARGVLDGGAISGADDFAAEAFGEGWRLIRPSRWGLLDDWGRWQPQADHGAGPVPCRHRFADGAYGCGRGLRLVPDLIASQGEIWAGLRLSAARAGSSLELRLRAPSGRLVGWVESDGPTPASLSVGRDGLSPPIRCLGRCPLTVEPGQAELVVRVTGPAPPAALTLVEASVQR